MSKSQEKYIMGIDCGGSKVKLMIANANTGKIVGKKTIEGCGLFSGNDKIVKKGISDILEKDFKIKKTNINIICLGVAGYLSLKDDKSRREVPSRLGLPEDTIVMSDLELIMRSSFKNQDGIVIICGTGSSAIGIVKDKDIVRVDGWGHLLGDRASGYWLSLLALRQAVIDFDHSGIPNKLLREAFKFFKVKDVRGVLSALHKENSKKIIASFAPIVINMAEQGERISKYSLNKCLENLGEITSLIYSKTGRITDNIVLSGGLFNNKYFLKLSKKIIRKHMKKANIFHSIIEPEFAALKIAAEKSGVVITKS